jgi:tartrate dehydratase beta subunit/fumarate hydratase class I family protein
LRESELAFSALKKVERVRVSDFGFEKVERVRVSVFGFEKS